MWWLDSLVSFERITQEQGSTGSKTLTTQWLLLNNRDISCWFDPIRVTVPFYFFQRGDKQMWYMDAAGAVRTKSWSASCIYRYNPFILYDKLHRMHGLPTVRTDKHLSIIGKLQWQAVMVPAGIGVTSGETVNLPGTHRLEAGIYLNRPLSKWTLLFSKQG